MANLAIKGHPTRGKEVIEILEMLGGQTDWCTGTLSHCVYFINKANRIDYTDKITDEVVFTLEQFLEKFPYKVGDKVLARGSAGEITDMKWQGDSFFSTKEGGEVVYTVMLDTEEEITFLVVDLQPYKEETMEEIKVDIPKGYEFAGVDDDKRQVVFEKIGCQYPKTYVECAKLLDCFGAVYIDGYKGELLDKFQELLICRDAYWKIAGDEMGLGKPWEPDWENTETDKYVIEIVKNTITIHDYPWNETNHLLAFPTKEMRDAFYENFKGLINETKELL